MIHAQKKAHLTSTISVKYWPAKKNKARLNKGEQIPLNWYHISATSTSGVRTKTTTINVTFHAVACTFAWVLAVLSFSRVKSYRHPHPNNPYLHHAPHQFLPHTQHLLQLDLYHVIIISKLNSVNRSLSFLPGLRLSLQSLHSQLCFASAITPNITSLHTSDPQSVLYTPPLHLISLIQAGLSQDRSKSKRPTSFISKSPSHTHPLCKLQNKIRCTLQHHPRVQVYEFPPPLLSLAWNMEITSSNEGITSRQRTSSPSPFASHLDAILFISAGFIKPDPF
jgi:hypothetical protein